MEFKIKTAKKGGEVTLEGDAEFFFWLVTAAGNARNGREGNEAETTEGKGKLVLQPTEPLLTRPDEGKRGIAEVAIRHSGAKAAKT